MQDFGEILSETRRNKKLTQEELAIKLGVTPQAISKWERGVGMPDVETLSYLSRVLNCSVDYLLSVEQLKLNPEDGIPEQKRLMSWVLAEPIMLCFGTGFIPLLIQENESNFAGLQAMRLSLAKEHGYWLPLIRLVDESTLEELEYQIRIYGQIVDSKKITSLEGVNGDSIYQHLKEVCVKNYKYILNRQVVKTLIDNVTAKHPAVTLNIPDKISYGTVQKILGILIDKGKPIRNLIKILELLEDSLESSKESASSLEAIGAYIAENI